MNFTSALLAPVVPTLLSSSDSAVNSLEPIGRLIYGNTCILTVTTFIAAGLLISFIVIGFAQFIRQLKKERKSDD